MNVKNEIDIYFVIMSLGDIFFLTNNSIEK